MRLLRSIPNNHAIKEHFSELLPLEGLPLSLSQLMAASTREGTMHISNSGEISFSVDAKLSTDITTLVEKLGYHVFTEGETTLITRSTSVNRGRRIALGALFPWHDGEMIVRNPQETVQGPIRMGNRGLTISLMTEAGKGASIRIPTETTVVFAGSLADNYFSYPLFAETLLSSPSSRLLDGVMQDGASVAVFHDDKGTGYFLSTPANDLDVESVAAIGKEIIQRSVLSTQEWTSPDGEAYEELRSDPKAITTDIRAEEDFTFITLAAGNERIRLTKTGSVLTISNRDITLDQTVVPQSSCLSNALFWANTSLYTSEIDNEVAIDTFTRSLFRSFSEIAVSSGKIRFCW